MGCFDIALTLNPKPAARREINSKARPPRGLAVQFRCISAAPRSPSAARGGAAGGWRLPAPTFPDLLDLGVVVHRSAVPATGDRRERASAAGSSARPGPSAAR